MLTEAQIRTVGNFDDPTIANLRPALGAGIEPISAAGTLSRAIYETQLTVSGSVAYTLEAPTVAGQRKRIVCVSAVATPIGTVTITNPDDTVGFVCAPTFQFDAPGQVLELVATSALRWRVTRVVRAGGTANEVVIGTTSISALNLRHTYYCSVTGTVASTTAARSIPNGSCAGEMIRVCVSTAASTPSGTIGIVGVTNAGAAATTLGTMAATTNYATLRWNGLAWEVIGNNTLVLS